jgi:hypothetical protein
MKTTGISYGASPASLPGNRGTPWDQSYTFVIVMRGRGLSVIRVAAAAALVGRHAVDCTAVRSFSRWVCKNSHSTDHRTETELSLDEVRLHNTAL